MNIEETLATLKNELLNVETRERDTTVAIAAARALRAALRVRGTILQTAIAGLTVLGNVQLTEHEDPIEFAYASVKRLYQDMIGQVKAGTSVALDDVLLACAEAGIMPPSLAEIEGDPRFKISYTSYNDGTVRVHVNLADV